MELFLRMRGDAEESWPLLGAGWLAADISFIRVFSNATTAILVNTSSILSPTQQVLLWLQLWPQPANEQVGRWGERSELSQQVRLQKIQKVF